MKKVSLLNAFLAFVLMAFIGAFVSSSVGLTPLQGAGAILVLGLITEIATMGSGMAFTAISITQLVSALGAYYRANKNIIIQNLYYGMKNEGWTIYDGVSDQLPLPKIGTTSLVKPANNATFSGTVNSIALTARIAQSRKWKVDLLLDPAALVNTWLGFTKQPGTRQTKIPLEQYVMQSIEKQVQQDLELIAKYKGVYNGAGTAPADVVNGLLKLIVDEVTATNITPTVTGVISNANVTDKLYLLHDALGDAAKESLSEAHVAPQIYDWAFRKFFPLTNPTLVATSNATGQDVGFANSFNLPGTNCKIMRKAGMGASQRCVFSVPGNLALTIDSESDYNNWEFQRFDRTIKVLGDGSMGVQVANIDPTVFVVNDQV